MATWYCDNSASGANDGTSWTDAWQSFADIVWSTGGVLAGDELLIKGGLTYQETLTVGVAGTLTSPVSIKGDDGSGNLSIVTIDGQSTRANGITASASFTQFCSFDSFRIIDTTGDGIEMGVRENCSYRRCESLRAGGNGMDIDRFSIVTECLSEGATLVGVRLGAFSFITDSVIRDNSDEGLIKADAVAINVLLYNNGTAHDCIQAGGAFYAGVYGCTIDGDGTTGSCINFTGSSSDARLAKNNSCHDAAISIEATNNFGLLAVGGHNQVNSTTEYTNWDDTSDDIDDVPTYEDEGGNNYAPGSGSVLIEAGADAGSVVGTSKRDIGAIQLGDSGGGGTTFIPVETG